MEPLSELYADLWRQWAQAYLMVMIQLRMEG